MRYSFLAVIVLCVALIGLPIQGALPYRVDSISPTAAAPGVNGVPLPPRAIARFGQGLINAIEISPDSKLIAVGGSVGVTVYEAATLKSLWSVRGVVKIMKWSPDSALLAADMSGVSVWNAATGRLAYQLKNSFPTKLEWSPDGKRLVMASWSGVGLIWYLKAGTLPIRLPDRLCDAIEPGLYVYEMYAALSPDGRFYATAYQCGGGGDVSELAAGVVIWDALSGVQKRVLPTSGNQLKWLHDSTHLLVSDPENGLTEWDTKIGQQVKMTPVNNDAFAPEGSFSLPSGELVTWEYICSGMQPCLVDVTDVNTTNCQQSSGIQPCLVDVNTGAVLCDSDRVSPDFKLCAYQDQDKPGVAFNGLTSDRKARRIEDISEIATFSPDWRFLVGWSANSPDDLNVWKVSDGGMIGRLAHRSHPLDSVVWSPDGRRLAIVDEDANVQLWDAVTRQFVQALPNSAATSSSASLIRAAFSPDGSRLAVSGINETLLIIWDMASGQPVAQADSANSSFNISAGMVWSPDGTEIALVNDKQQVFVVNAATGIVLRSTGANAEAECYGEVNGISWSPDSKQIALGSCGGQIILFDAATLNKASTLTYRTGALPHDAIPYLAYSPDGKSLATVIPLPDQYMLAIWDLASGRLRNGQITSNEPNLLLPMSSLAWSPNGKFLAVGFGTAISQLGGFFTTGGDVTLFSARTAQQVARLQGHTDDADGISFSPDGKYLASASRDGTVLIWDLTGL